MARYDRSVTLTDQSGDFINLGNPLPTSGGGGGGSGGTSMADKSTFAEGTTQFTPIGGVRLDTPVSDVADGKTAAVRITPKRAMWATLRNEGGTEIATSSDPLRTDPTGTTAQPVNDNGGSLTVDDGGGSITVDGIVAATQSGTWTVTANAGTGIFAVETEVQLDYDTSGGTQSLSVVGIALPGNGGAVAGGTSTNPIRIDPTGTTAQPVTDGGGSLTVDDGGGSITVDGTVAATQSGTWSVQLTDGSLTASIRNTGSNDSLNVAIVDASGNHIVSFGGGTQYTEADVDATPMGTISMWWNDGDNSIHVASPTNPFPVTVVSGGGGGMVDDSPFTPGSDTVVPMGALFDDVATDTIDEGDIGAPRMSGSRILYVSTFAGSPVAVTDNGGSLTVDGTVSISGSVTVTGTVAVSSVAGNVTVVQSTATNLKVDASGVAVPVTDDGGSLTIDGSVSISGTVTVAQTNINTADYDSGAGTVTQSMMGLALPASGGPVAGGTATNPVRTDPTGTTAQPITDNGGSLTVDGTVAVSAVSGNVTVVQSTATNLKVDASGVAVPVTDNGGSLTVDGTVAISGTVTVAQTNINTADYDSGAGTVTQSMMGIALPASGGPVAGGTATNPLRTDPTGTTAQPITDNGGSLTVDGTVAVAGTTASGASLATTLPVYVGMNSGSGLGRHLTAIVANRDTDGTAILGVAPVGWDAANSLYRDLEVDASTNLKVALGAALPAGTAVIGSMKLTDGTTVATVRELGTNDAVNVAICDGSGNQITSFGGGLTDDSPFTPGSGTGQGMFAFADETSTDSVDEGDAGIVRMTLDRILRTISQTENGVIRVDGTQLTVKRASISIAATGDQTVITAVVSKKLRILAIALSSTVIAGIQLKSNATTVIERIGVDKRSPFFMNMMPSGYIMETTSGEAFKLNTDTAGQLSGVVVYCEV